VKGIRFGIVGVTTEQLGTTTHPRHLNGVTVNGVVPSVEALLPELRKQADFIVVLAHAGDAEEQALAKAFPEIRLIVGGHNHSALGPFYAGKTLVAKTGSSGRNVGRVDLYFEGKTLRNMEARLIPVQRIAPDSEVSALLAPFHAEAEVKLREVVGEAAGELVSSASEESPLANLVVDAMRVAGGTQIAIHNPGGIRARLDAGTITWGEVFEVLPFQNTLVTMRLSGAQLKRVLSQRLLLISGLRMRVNPAAPAGRRLLSLTLADGTEIGDAQEYTVTTNDFLVAGGDGASEFGRGAAITDTGIPLRDALVNYLRRQGRITPSLDGRITVAR
jgi:2',3'-cyclic-nucleotide 2'-phosphodiesterase/3'-nucleotidase